MSVYGTINDKVYTTGILPLTAEIDDPVPISVVEVIVPAPLTFRYIEKSLGEVIKNESQVKQIVEYLKNKREIKSVSEIKRFSNK